jgi:hypothetical protein
VKIKVIGSISAEMEPRIYDFLREVGTFGVRKGVKRGIFVLFDFPAFFSYFDFWPGFMDFWKMAGSSSTGGPSQLPDLHHAGKPTFGFAVPSREIF